MKKTILLFVAILAVTGTLKAQQQFDREELRIIQHPSEKGLLRVLQTTVKEDSLKLRRIAQLLDVKEPKLQALLDLLLHTVQDPENEGVGIAAPQVGVNKQLFLVQRFDKEGTPFEAILNPTILWTSNLIQAGREGCLSIPDTMGIVNRFYSIRVQYQTPRGEWNTEILEGFTAVIFQHEYDHLMGKLFIDRLAEQQQQEYITPQHNFYYLSGKNTR